MPALATLAWDPRRATFFRGELFNALEILNRGDIDLPRLKGSWAGAMGQVQFMPSSYLKFAEDFDGDGKRDIWSTPADVFASIANYLKGHGWAADQSWGREVKVTPEAARQIARDVAPRTGSCQATRNMTVAVAVEPMAGARRAAAQAARRCPRATTPASLVSGDTPSLPRRRRTTTRFSTTTAPIRTRSRVALLGDAIASDKAPAASKPTKAAASKQKHGR